MDFRCTAHASALLTTVQTGSAQEGVAAVGIERTAAPPEGEGSPRHQPEFVSFSTRRHQSAIPLAALDQTPLVGAGGEVAIREACEIGAASCSRMSMPPDAGLRTTLHSLIEEIDLRVIGHTQVQKDFVHLPRQ